MYGPNEAMANNEKFKAMAARECGRSMATEPCRPSLMERVATQRVRAQHEADQFGRLNELQILLDKNPEVARILDLMDCLKG